MIDWGREAARQTVVVVICGRSLISKAPIALCFRTNPSESLWRGPLPNQREEKEVIPFRRNQAQRTLFSTQRLDLVFLDNMKDSSVILTALLLRPRRQRLLLRQLLVVWSLVHVVLAASSIDSATSSSSSPFIVIIDGGSTGSRLHIFEFVASNTTTTNTRIERRGTMRTDGPLSAYAAIDNDDDDDDDSVNDTALAMHILPCLDYAASIIPKQYHTSTRVSYQATAGMRLLTPKQQDDVYQGLQRGLQQQLAIKNPFAQFEIATLSGELEGYYGVLAANYLHGTLTADLEWQHSPDHEYLPIGALDMGGSSTQIVFLPGMHANDNDEQQSCRAVEDSTVNGSSSDDETVPTTITTTCHVATPRELHDSTTLTNDDFFATSYLSYGVDQFRERLFDTWIQEHDASTTQQQQQSTSRSTQQCTAKLLENPCAFVGHQQVYQGYTLIGTGQANDCMRQVQRLIPHADECDRHDQLGRHVGSVPHPPVRGKFLAMSLYFFALDSLRELATNHPDAHDALNRAWPTPSIQELVNALDGLCSRSWHGDLELIQHEAHAFTRAEILPHRCLESVYLVTLLRDGFGFAPESRDITFTFLVDGSEVEWTLGMALALRAEEEQQQAELLQSSGVLALDKYETRKGEGSAMAALDHVEDDSMANETCILPHYHETIRDAHNSDAAETPLWSMSVIHTIAQRYFAANSARL